MVVVWNGIVNRESRFWEIWGICMTWNDAPGKMTRGGAGLDGKS